MSDRSNQILNLFKSAVNAVALAIFIFSGNIASAKSLELANGKVIPNVNPIAGELNKDELSLFDIVIGSSKLADVKKIFGEDLILSSGKGINEVFFLCYIDKRGNILAYESSMPMGGGQLITSGYLVGPKGSYTFKKDCKKSSKEFGSIEIGDGIKLGTSFEKIKKSKGPASYSSKSSLIYLFETSRLENGKTAEVMDILRLEAFAKTISEITITRVLSY